jgi:Phage major capsid protein E
MTLGIYDTAVLTRVINRMDKQPPLFLLNTFFTLEQTSDSDRIYFDVERLRPRIAPFVPAHLPGKIVEEIGYDTQDFKPAYVKPKTVLSPNGAIKRVMGEQIAGALSPEQRQKIRLNNALSDHALMLSRREEVMVSEALRTGFTTVSGEGFATVVVDFKRDASLTVALAGNDRWSINDAASDPLTDLETMSGTSQTLGAGTTPMIVMEPTAWQAMRTRLAQRGELPPLAQFDRSSASRFEIGPQLGDKVQYIGKFGAFDIFTYQDTYLDDAGTPQLMMPLGTVIGGNASSIEGTRCYGMIQDEKSGLKAERFFAKSWLEEDPAVRYLLSQSAPLPVPYRPNASWCMKVFG